jgi:hypothetical protein
MTVSSINRRKALLLALALSVAPVTLSVGASAQTSTPGTADECRSYAAQKANEEYMSQVATNRENSPFARSPSGRPDPLQQSANQQANIDKAGRERQLYDACVAKLPK